MIKIIRKNILTITGAIAGIFYWKFIGCSTGKGYIQSNPVKMTLYGTLLGGLSFNIFQSEIRQQ
ncbi:hypothetical protein [Ferruginibacter sp.]|uniref:hypothetical protein n=1 Tax=Ferruginibacter sp. TaxID=1940288 RepID=UPI001992E355|nr:hypothetical protein [Ferruginibacter sp.]MBC7629412.1 hypothetical protein [Ferruginibacter sp.]